MLGGARAEERYRQWRSRAGVFAGSPPAPLVFGGDVNGRFRAFDNETGEVLWAINIGSPVTGFPTSYAVDGRQYIAVGTGFSATSGSFTALTPQLRPSQGNNLFVFALP